jgi:hypothetical protein
MGEAKRRREERGAWISGLTSAELAVVAAAEHLYFGFVGPKNFEGACYQLSLFFKVFLEEERGTPTDVVLGFVNDGTDEIYASHAWIEHFGRKTDLALAHPNHPGISRRGAVLILDRVAKPGLLYRYTTKPPFDPFDPTRYDLSGRSIVEDKRSEHAHIASIIAGGIPAIRAYLDGAPEGTKYEQLAAIARRPLRP